MLKPVLILLILLSCWPAFAESGFPCLKLTNKSKEILTVRHDPNWDDQVLVVNGHEQHSLDADLAPNEEIEICGLWYQFGIDFYMKGQFVFAEVSNQESQYTTISESYPEGVLNYGILHQDKVRLVVEMYTMRVKK